MDYTNNCKIEFSNVRRDDIPDDDYFKIEGISNSKLKLINPKENGSPEKYLAGFDNSFNPSLILGTAVHAMVLQEDSYILSNYKGKPSGKCGYFIDLIFKYRKKGLPLQQAIDKASEQADYYHNKLSPKILRKSLKKGIDYYLRKLKGEFSDKQKEVLVLPEKLLDTAKKCIRAVKRNAEYQRMFTSDFFSSSNKEIYNEYALIADIKVILPDESHVKFLFKCKLDNYIIDHDKKQIIINDLKTTSKNLDYFKDIVVEGEAFTGAFGQHCYYRQAGIYCFILQMYVTLVLHLTGYTMYYNNIVVETTGDLRAMVAPVNNAYILEGLREFKDLVCRVAFHEQYGYHRIYPNDIQSK